MCIRDREYLGGLADYVSLHRYVGIGEESTEDFLAIPNSIDQQIEEVDAACRFVQGKRKSKKRAWLCFDEWNVWYKTMKFGSEHMQGGGRFAPPLIEEVYDLRDALVVSGSFTVLSAMQTFSRLRILRRS